jgi:hypothetical protein
VEQETRGGWYGRQMLGSANLTGGRLFHILSGNLSYQIEHHLFPDIPARRYGELAVEVREICERYGLPYNTGSLPKQFGSVVKKIVRLAVPWGGGDTTSDATDLPSGAGAASRARPGAGRLTGAHPAPIGANDMPGMFGATMPRGCPDTRRLLPQTRVHGSERCAKA